MQTLLERTTAGFRVVLSYDPSSKVVWLTGETELHGSMVTVAPESASNAFEHPCCYLESPALFFKAASVSWDESNDGGDDEEHTASKGYDNLMDALDNLKEICPDCELSYDGEHICDIEEALEQFKEYGGETAADHLDEEDGA